jgi:hypothetical protein
MLGLPADLCFSEDEEDELLFGVMRDENTEPNAGARIVLQSIEEDAKNAPLNVSQLSDSLEVENAKKELNPAPTDEMASPELEDNESSPPESEDWQEPAVEAGDNDDSTNSGPSEQDEDLAEQLLEKVDVKQDIAVEPKHDGILDTMLELWLLDLFCSLHRARTQKRIRSSS